MTRQFTFSDTKSAKFWHIHTHETALTVTFGRIGTTGQSQTKTFDTAARCEQEAAKLIREKTAKGYVEEGASAVPQPVVQANDNGELEALLKRYDEIIRKTLLEELLPFLKGVDKRYYKELGKKIKEAKKYWCDYITLDVKDPEKLASENRYDSQRWGVRGTANQANIVKLSELALLPHSKNRSGDLYWLLSGNLWFDYTLPLLQWSRPTWLTEFLAAMAQSNSWRTLSYLQLRMLENENLVDYQPALFALSISKFRIREDYKTEINDPKTYSDFLVSDQTVLTREIPSMFDYQTWIQESYDSIRNKDGTYQAIQLWPTVFTRLLNEGKLDRLWFFERCLSVQTKDWPADLRSFYRKQLEANNPTTAEWLALQPSLFPLLAAEHPHVVNWAAGVVKTLHTEPDFNTTTLLDWAGPTLSRSDCKTAIKTLLPVLERLLKTQPDLRPSVAGLLAEVFAVADLTLQTKAAALLAKHADPADAPLREQLQTYAGQMLGNVPNDLRPFLTNPETTDEPETTGPVSYQYALPKPVQRLVPGQEVRLPETWNEFLFLIGKFITSDDPLDMEILMNALILQPKDRPDDWREQLAPYQKKLERTYFPAVAKRILQQYLRHWLVEKNDIFDDQSPSTMFTFRALGYRMKSVDRKLKRASTLPLLSLPTHQPHWISPEILIRRLLDYQEAEEPIDLLDFAIAITRMVREKGQDSISLCTSLTDEFSRNLMLYCLDGTDEIQLPKTNFLSKIINTIKSSDLIVNEQALWSTAARTFNPDDHVKAFSDTPLSEIPNVAQPFIPDYWIESKRSSWYDHVAKRQVESGAVYHNLRFETPTIKRFVSVLLYSNDLHNQQNPNYSNLQRIDVGYWYSLVAQYPEPLFIVTGKHSLTSRESLAAHASSIPLMLQPGFQFREMSMLVLACGLLAQKRETATLAAGVVIHHIGEQTLDVDRLGDRLGWLLAGNYAPVQRLTDALNLVRDVSPPHNKALLLTLDALFGQLATGDEPPKNTKKLLELYLDLLVKLNERVSPQTAQTLLNWQKANALKKSCEAIVRR